MNTTAPRLTRTQLALFVLLVLAGGVLVAVNFPTILGWAGGALHGIGAAIRAVANLL